MSSFWFFEGLRKGRKTEKFPRAPPESPPLRPSRMKGEGFHECPTDAIAEGEWVQEKCIFCRRCEEQFKPTGEQDIFDVKRTEKILMRSIHLYRLDSGSCGACNTEFSAIFDPQYDAHRLRIFETNTPRHADAIVIMGIATDGMKEALDRAYEAMPEPKLVIALGACAVSGGVLGDAPLDRDMYDVEIAGCPPSPYTILEAIDRARGDSHD
ncbi:NADH:ubiquinone oxidoreductase [uncultured archaeon]|nr:NADH:ubiquinone oxidoreductase [uncultured archaeon]